MKVLETFQGGHPFQLDDVKHVQSSFTEFVEQCFARMGSPGLQPCILTGCYVSGSAPSRQVSAGWVYWGNKVYRVPAATVTGSQTHIVLAPASINPPNPVIYANGVPRYCHMDYIMVATSANAPLSPLVMNLEIAPRWPHGPWVDITLGPDFASGPIGGPAAGPRYRKSIGDKVELSGCVKGNSPGGLSSTLFTLPLGHRPSRRLRFAVPYTSAPGSTALGIIDVETSGDVNAFPVPATGQEIYLDGLSFDAD